MNSAIAGTPGLPPRYRFLGDRNYSVWVNERGSGGSFSGDLLLTSLGGTRNQAPEGFLFFLRNLETGEFGILGQKTAKFDWKPGIVSIFQDLDGILARLDICLVPGTAAEIRKVTLANKTGAPVRLDLTTFAEVVLNRKEAHLAHPGFSKLFLQTEFDESRQCLLVQRRPRDPKDIYPLLVHAFLGFGKVEYETARPGFLGRGRPLTRPVALTSPEPLSGAVGNVLDPVVSLRKNIQLLPDEPGRAGLSSGNGLAPGRRRPTWSTCSRPRSRSPTSSRPLRPRRPGRSRDRRRFGGRGGIFPGSGRGGHFWTSGHFSPV